MYVYIHVYVYIHIPVTHRVIVSQKQEEDDEVLLSFGFSQPRALFSSLGAARYNFLPMYVCMHVCMCFVPSLGAARYIFRLIHTPDTDT
jgi:hypothetical protein